MGNRKVPIELPEAEVYAADIRLNHTQRHHIHMRDDVIRRMRAASSLDAMTALQKELRILNRKLGL